MALTEYRWAITLRLRDISGREALKERARARQTMEMRELGLGRQ
jgi:hypothetical protein